VIVASRSHGRQASSSSFVRRNSLTYQPDVHIADQREKPSLGCLIVRKRKSHALNVAIKLPFHLYLETETRFTALLVSPM
jgi:hypothetical protein